MKSGKVPASDRSQAYAGDSEMMATFFPLDCCIVIFYIFYNVTVLLCLFILNLKTFKQLLIAESK